MIEVYKYGGTLLKSENTRKEIYDFLKTKKEEGTKIIMVVSAFGRGNDCFSTDNLSKNIELLSNKDKDQIITFGEIYSSLIIKNELLKEGIKVESISYDEIGILCDNSYQDGNIKHVDISYLKDLIKENDVVIVPGFIAESSEGKIISLGRNTSDLTAVIIGNELGLDHVDIIKDVDGVYKKDPKEGKSHLINYLSYDEMIALLEAGSSMFSKKTLDYAKDNNIIINIKGLGKKEGSIISNTNSDEDILFINNDTGLVRVVFKNMDLVNKLFEKIINKKIKLEDLYIINNIIYIKGNKQQIMEIIDEYI